MTKADKLIELERKNTELYNEALDFLISSILEKGITNTARQLNVHKAYISRIVNRKQKSLTIEQIFELAKKVV